MTIGDAILALEKLKVRHGEKVEVYFDCPICHQSFTPGVVVPVVVHWKAEKKA